MNPERQPSQITPNQEPRLSSPEIAGDYLSSPEKNVETSQEKEKTPQNGDGQPLSPPVITPSLPVPVAMPVTSVEDDESDIPTLAADDDLIEKEWVNKAKKINLETKDDPHKREQRVGQLQVDYLRKRYGKELGVSN